jgi:hypothetical protein
MGGQRAVAARMGVCVAHTRTQRLVVEKVSKAVAKQGRRVARTTPWVVSMRWRRSGAAIAASGDAAQV